MKSSLKRVIIERSIISWSGCSGDMHVPFIGCMMYLILQRAGMADGIVLVLARPTIVTNRVLMPRKDYGAEP